MIEESIITVRDLNYTRDGRIILDSVSFDLHRKHLLGLVGPNGAGKTTLVHLILGQLKPDSGEILIEGKPPGIALRSGVRIGYMSQSRNIERDIPVTVMETVLMARYDIVGLFRKPGDEDIKIAHDALSAVKMLDREDRLIGELSGGELQRVLIARALARQPNVLLLDEPDSGLDVEAADVFMNLLAHIRNRYGIGIMLISHDIGAVTRHADCIACINKKLYFHDRPGKLTPEALTNTFGEDIQFLVHEIPNRCLECHDD